jgi:positive regulator of sigma E activity
MQKQNTNTKENLSKKAFKEVSSFIFIFSIPFFIIMILWNYFPFIFFNNKTILIIFLLLALIFSWSLVIYKYKKLKSLYERKEKSE